MKSLNYKTLQSISILCLLLTGILFIKIFQVKNENSSNYGVLPQGTAYLKEITVKRISRKDYYTKEFDKIYLDDNSYWINDTIGKILNNNSQISLEKNSSQTEKEYIKIENDNFEYIMKAGSTDKNISINSLKKCYQAALAGNATDANLKFMIEKSKQHITKQTKSVYFVFYKESCPVCHKYLGKLITMLAANNKIIDNKIKIEFVNTESQLGKLMYNAYRISSPATILKFNVATNEIVETKRIRYGYYDNIDQMEDENLSTENVTSNTNIKFDDNKLKEFIN